MKKYKELELDDIKSLRAKCGLENDEELNDLSKLSEYEGMLEDLIEKYENLCQKNKKKLDDFDPRLLFDRRSPISREELIDQARSMRSMFTREIKMYDKYYNWACDELQDVSEHILKIKKKKKEKANI